MPCRKHCSKCGHWRPAFDFSPHKGRLSSECKTCSRLARRKGSWAQQSGLCKRGHALTPENTYKNKGQRRCRRCRIEGVAQWQRDNREHVREYQRIWDEGRRRKQGAKWLDNNRWRNRTTPVEETVRGFPAEPFADWLRETVGDKEIVGWAREHGVSDKLVRDVLSGHRTYVALDSIDKVLTAHGEPWMLDELYPLEVAA